MSATAAPTATGGGGGHHRRHGHHRGSGHRQRCQPLQQIRGTSRATAGQPAACNGFVPGRVRERDPRVILRRERFTTATGAKPAVVMYYERVVCAVSGRLRRDRCQPRCGAARADGPGRYQRCRDCLRAVRRLPERLRRGRPRLPSPGHRELRPRNERQLVFLGYGKTSPATFVKAWRHIVTLFRVLGAGNVTWLWTVNIINNTQVGKIPNPAHGGPAVRT